MSRDFPNVYTIAPGNSFLHVLAREILRGFPLAENEVRPPLSRWTILMPTRRAARELTDILAELSGASSVLLPRIKPIGDLDEDRLASDDEQGDLPKAISRTGHLFMILSLLHEWAKDNPTIALAQEIENSHVQSLGLAISLLKLLTQVETEETDFGKFKEAYAADLSEHRGAILSLIELLKDALPKRLASEDLISSTTRRSRLIRLEAQRISEGKFQGPIIAAGSTGTIPATRALLKAIANYHQGAVILPGLDKIVDEDAWQAITPEHPQFSLKTLIDELGVKRQHVKVLGASISYRNWLAAEFMRPASTAEQWHDKLKDKKEDTLKALQNLGLVEAPDRATEARSIALILRQALETPKQKAALITPDRDLAQRVKAEMLRWNVTIDDSAGEPLLHYGLASLAARLLHCVADDFTPQSLLALLKHPLCNLGLGQTQLSQNMRNLEIAVLRGYGGSAGLVGIRLAFERAVLAKLKKQRSHDLVSPLKDTDWEALEHFIQILIAALKPLSETGDADFQTHLANLTTCLEALAPDVDQSSEGNIAFSAIMFELENESRRLPEVSFAAASIIIVHFLRNEPHRKAVESHPRLAIYGVLEARLIPADIVILGGLNEGKWPAQPDPGPWLNRTMRIIFGLQHPEREIGLSAHDFTQGFGNAKVYLTWSKRIEGSPQIPSRWILRLQNVLEAGGVDYEDVLDQSWVTLAKLLDDPDSVLPFGKPQATPPIAARPTRFSVSAVEKLIRDPYAVYASRVLRLNPLPPVAQQADAALRGTLFHEAISAWNQIQSEYVVSDSLNLLIDQGRKTFAPLMSDPEVASFWWPRFCRMAAWLVDQEFEFRKSAKKSFAETEGLLEFDVNGVAYSLYARADRIDMLDNGKARIIDYKTGAVPSVKQVMSGMKPQLPLEAAILALQGFLKISPAQSDELVFLNISGATDEGKRIAINSEKEPDPTELGIKHFNEFKSLLRSYQNPDQPYYPRASLFKEDEKSDYDHLSRFAEWTLAGD